jgi:hypothetical protein
VTDWTRVQALVDASGLPACLAMAGRPELPHELAEKQVPKLKQAGADIRRDETGRPVVLLGEPAVQAWLADLGTWVAELSREIEWDIQASRLYGIEIEHATPEVPGS